MCSIIEFLPYTNSATKNTLKESLSFYNLFISYFLQKFLDFIFEWHNFTNYFNSMLIFFTLYSMLLFIWMNYINVQTNLHWFSTTTQHFSSTWVDSISNNTVFELVISLSWIIFTLYWNHSGYYYFDLWCRCCWLRNGVLKMESH